MTISDCLECPVWEGWADKVGQAAGQYYCDITMAAAIGLDKLQWIYYKSAGKGKIFNDVIWQLY